MDVETALRLTDALVFGKTSHYLNTLQTQIFRGAWMGQTYSEMVTTCYCSEPHLKKVGSILWELLSEVFEEEVRKNTIQATLERYYRNKQPSLDFSSGPTEIALGAPPAITQTQSLTTFPELPSPEGPVELGSPFYIERQPSEALCRRAILQPGSLIQIKGAPQIGKTSFLARLLDQGKQEGYQTVALTLQLADSQVLQNLDRFLQWFCASVTRKLQLPLKLKDYWDDVFGSKTNCKDYFEHYLLPHIDRPCVLAIDVVDLVFQAPSVAEEFFALLRIWHEEAKINPLWQNLRMILVYSLGVENFPTIQPPPLNVGLTVELSEFSAEQVEELVRQHGLIQPDVQCDRPDVPSFLQANSPSFTLEEIYPLWKLIGGHPYLVRVALYHLAYCQVSIQDFLALAPTEMGPYHHHLQAYLSRLEKQPELAAILKTFLNSINPPQQPSTELFQLSRMGLLRFQNGQFMPRCELYRQFFSRRFTE